MAERIPRRDFLRYAARGAIGLGVLAVGGGTLKALGSEGEVLDATMRASVLAEGDTKHPTPQQQQEIRNINAEIQQAKTDADTGAKLIYGGIGVAGAGLVYEVKKRLE